MSHIAPKISKEEMKPEHGTVQAYVTGFILSLVFTFIPYYLVTNETTKGTKLLAIILGFGVLQMLVQLLFFLHLGRKPRPAWQIIFLIWTVASVLIVIGGSIIITHNLHHNMMPTDQYMKITNDEGIAQVGGKETGACEGQHANHQVIITDDFFNPEDTIAKQCDTLTFTNQSSDTAEIGFTKDSEDTSYAGVEEYSIRPGMNKTITLSEFGTFDFHSHLDAETTGSFTVED